MSNTSSLSLQALAGYLHAPDELERRVAISYATEHSPEGHRLLEQYAYERFDDFNARYWGGRLVQRHIGFGATPARSVVVFRETTSYGAAGQILFNECFALTAKHKPRWVIRGFPSPGFRRAFDALLLRAMTEQACWELPELRRQCEQGSAIGTLTQERNRIGMTLNLPPVAPRRRPSDEEDVPVVAAWPFHGLDDDHFLGDLTAELLSLIRGGRRQAAAGQVPSLSVYAYFHRLLEGGEHEKLLRLFTEQRDRYEDRRLGRLPYLRRFEEGTWDVDGITPLPKITVEPAWLSWANHLVAGVAQGIALDRRFDELPILADALEDAGCDNCYLLRHLRHRMEHTRSCWALRLLTQAARPEV